jgi:PAS domain S-box-containing protein
MASTFFASTRFRLFVLVLLAILPVSALIYYNAVQRRDREAAEVREDAMRLTGLVAVHHQQMLSGARELLANLAQQPDIRAHDSYACTNFFSQLMTHSSDYFNYAAVAPDGVVFCSAQPLSEAVNLKDRTWFQRALQNRGFTMGEFQIARIIKNPSLTLAYPVMDHDRRIVAVVAVALNLTSLSRFPGETNLPDDSELLVLDRGGTILAHTPNFDQWVGKNLPDSPIVRSVLTQRQGTIESAGADGMMRLYAFTPVFVEPGDVPDMYVAVGIPTEAAFAAVDQELYQNVLALVVVAVFTLVIAWLGGNQLLLKHLTALVAASRRLASGDLSARLGLRQGRGELSVLAQAFDDMAEALERRETQLRQSEQRYRTIFENTGTAMVLIEEDTTVSLVNSKFETIGGYSREEVEGKKSWTEWIVPEELERLREYHWKRRLDPVAAPREYETRLVDKDGNLHDVLVNVTLIPETQCSLLSALDITERKRAEQELRLLSMAIEQAAETIVITDTEGTIQYVNPAFEHTTGYLRAEAIGHNPRVLASGRHEAAFYEEMWAALKRGEVWMGNFINKRKNGTLYEEEAVISPVRNAAGEIAHYVAVKRDVTREVEMEKQLRQAQKMEAIGTLAGGIAHDFNNVLGAVLGYTELALLDTPQHSPAAGSLREVLKGCQRARELVKQILAFSRMSGQERKPVQLGQVFEETIKLIRASIPTTISIRSVIDMEGLGQATVMADPIQMHQILVNLCTNAAQAMRNHGGVLEVGLSSGHFGADDPARPPEFSPGPYVTIWVRDSGPGMEPATLERIFDPFFTTKGPGEGTGMGLAVVHGIVERHHGAIRVESLAGVGSTFFVWLPRIESAPSETEGDETNDIPTGSERILLVDDDLSLLDAGAKVLQRLGYEVESRSSSLEALRLFREAPEHFDLLITDQIMPQMTGIDLAREVLAMRPTMPILLCSGFNETVNAESIGELGIRAFVLKPLIIAEVAKVVRQVLDGGRAEAGRG